MLAAFDKNNDSFNDILNIMHEAFPECETRTDERQRALLDNPHYKIMLCRGNGQKTAAFIAYWQLEGFVFIEHFAVSQALRGGGIGANFMREFLSFINMPVILEVEPPDTQAAIRRIEFYKRLGFKHNRFEYMQPPMREQFDYIRLDIMSCPQSFTKNEFLPLKNKIYKLVYGADV